MITHFPQNISSFYIPSTQFPKPETREASQTSLSTYAKGHDALIILPEIFLFNPYCLSPMAMTMQATSCEPLPLPQGRQPSL